MRVHANELLQCVFCPYRTPRDDELNLHYRFHYKIFEYKCDLCEKSYIDALRLNQHQKDMHKIGEVFKCHLCEYASTKANLQRHYRNKHKLASQWNKVKKRFDTFEK